ncbi:Phosphatidylinositol 4-phosphate 3-kinase C2 domain-containing subunit alpha [Halotydeus destructor]|nr:Phosphatidylinositol 4-phosphate 3-kinase C2 domain-containing subunit alpha [Halotydeus destructor]
MSQLKRADTIPTLPPPIVPKRPISHSLSSQAIARPRKASQSTILDYVPPPPSRSKTIDSSASQMSGDLFQGRPNNLNLPTSATGFGPTTSRPQSMVSPINEFSGSHNLMNMNIPRVFVPTVSSHNIPKENAHPNGQSNSVSPPINLINNSLYFTNYNQVPSLKQTPFTPTHHNQQSASSIAHSHSTPSFRESNTFEKASFTSSSNLMTEKSAVSINNSVLSCCSQAIHVKSHTNEFKRSPSSSLSPDDNLIDLGLPVALPMSETGEAFSDIVKMFDPLHVNVVQESIYEVLQEASSRARSESEYPEPTSDQEDSNVYEVLKVTNSNDNKEPARKGNLTVIKRTVKSDKELANFHQKMLSVRKNYPFDRLNTNSGLVISPILTSQRDNSLSVKLVITTNLQEAPICFTCNVNTTIEHVVSHVVCAIIDDVSKVDFDSYVLKVNGLEEYLAIDSTLTEYAYVLECHKFDRDVRLKLINTSELNRIYARTALDDKRCLSTKPDDLMPVSVTNMFKDVSCEALSILLDILGKEINKLKLYCSKALPGDVPRTGLTQGLIQAVKAICSQLGSFETDQLREALEDLSQHFVAFSSVQGLDIDIGILRNTVNEVIDNSIYKLRLALYEILKLYSEAFPVDFEAKFDGKQSNSETAKRTQSLASLRDKMRCYVGAVSQLKAEWKTQYREFYVLCELWHGESRLAKSQTKRTALHKSGSFGLFENLIFNEWVDLDIQLKTLPRETCLYYALVGTAVSVGGDSTELEERTMLSITAIRLFDFTESLLEGKHITGMWLNSDVEKNKNKFSIHGPCYNKASPLIIVGLPERESKIIFPIITADSETNNNQSPRRGMHSLDSATQTEIYQTLNRNPLDRSDSNERTMLWERRHHLYEVPSALPRVLKANTSWEASTLLQTYKLIDKWSELSAIDAMQLLLPAYPDVHVRRKAVEWIDSLGDDELCDYLPQLVQAVRFEPNLDSPLVWLFIERSLKNVRVAHNLYWLLKENINDQILGYRCRVLLNVLILCTGNAMKTTFELQEDLLSKLSEVNEVIKPIKDSHRLKKLHSDLDTVQIALESVPNGLCLPLGPGMIVNSVYLNKCSYFTSNTLPLKLVFKSPDSKTPENAIEAIYKVGDDLRQDTLTMQIIRIMDKLWLKEGMNLKIVTFGCVSTDERKGILELVKNAETLRVIQSEQGITGSFNEKAIVEWLKKYNATELEYQQAVDNFTCSCAGYAVATYVLGICDRHNDNIMITTNGHLFHIDFGKFLGDSQMMGAIKRDRVPFVLTSDMAFVINGGSNTSKKFQEFVDLCCGAYNIVRRHTNLFLSLFTLMTSASIPGLTEEAVKYVHQTLCPELSESEAMTQFTRKIEESLRSKSTQLNFFVHNLAQLRFTGDHNDQRVLSFATKTFTKETDGKIHSIEVEDIHKRYEPEKLYYHRVRIVRAFQPDPSYVLRTFDQFYELYEKLSTMFPLAFFYRLNRGTAFQRSNTRDVALRRKEEINIFLEQLLRVADEVSHSDIVYTFFHPILIDQEELGADMVDSHREPRRESITDGQIKLSIHYKNASLKVMVMHARNLVTGRASPPECYVKMYLNPDPYKNTKRKTKVVAKSHHPTFMEMIVYSIPLEMIKERLLQVAVWEISVKGNNYLGAAMINLAEMDLLTETTSWFPFNG